MKNKIIRTIIIVMLLTSCSTILKSTEELANIATINEVITSGEVAAIIKHVNLSSTDSLLVDHAINRFIQFANKWKREILFLDASTSLFPNFLLEYKDMITQYKAVERVIIRNWDKYPVAYQTSLLNYQLKARKANSAVDSLIQANRINQAIIDSIILAKTLAGVVIR